MVRLTEYLDIDDMDRVLALARGSWARWAAREPAILTTTPDELDGWLRTASPPDGDEVLHALASLAARDGGDDTVAARTLAWTLRRGACALTRELASIPGDTQFLVAGHLWIQIRTFNWRRLHRVAGNILMRTRSACLLEAGTKPDAPYGDRSWRSAAILPPESVRWARLDAGVRGPAQSSGRGSGDGDAPSVRATRYAAVPPEQAPMDEVGDVLTWAIAAGVISTDDAELLLRVVEQARMVDTRTGDRNLGFTAPAVAIPVSADYGVCHATIRRRTARALQALAAAAEQYVA